VLCAPTGCASFHLKFGAATLHRVFGVPVGRFKKWVDPRNPRFVRVQKRLRRAVLIIMDELSMIGRQMLGKTDTRACEVLGSGGARYGEAAVSFGGRDVLLAGDPKQCQPIGDDPMYKEGEYKGRGRKRGDGDDDTVAAEDLSNRGLTIRKEFRDVVILQKVWRLDDGHDGMSAEERAAYREAADRFLSVTRGMVDCTWTPEDRDWLAQRNRTVLARTREGRAALREFEDAPLLMDGRRKNKQGHDGAMQVNSAILRRHAARVKKPIAALRAFHDGPDEASRRNLDKWDAEDFRGMPAVLELCEGARVLLTQNLWVEAGLMNGALGRVVGYVWPEGGDPASEDSAKKSPLCVVVEFDELYLGEEPDPSRPGHMRPRSFFPGEPEKRRWVPIYRQRTFSASEASVYREQFPLTLAWALTHWKAQGMTLRRVRIRLGNKIAATPGVGFVAVTRVRHPSHLLFEDDLPEWGVFQNAQFTENFRSRKRFELRMQARFSETIRRYEVLCEADPWTRREAEMAEILLRGLSAVGELQRSAVSRGGRRADIDAHLWPEGEPDFDALLEAQLLEYARGAEELVAEAVLVKERLLGALHLPAVREALGCLIPAYLHPKDDGKKPRGGLSLEHARVGVFVQAGAWKVDVSEEQRLAESGTLFGPTCEFFLIVLRRVCARLRLPVAVGSVALGTRLGAVDRSTDRLLPSSADVRRAWSSWRPEELRDASVFLVPIGLLGQRDVAVDWVFACVSAGGAGETLGNTRKLRVDLLDNRDPGRQRTLLAEGKDSGGISAPRGCCVRCCGG
jgi:hypothetical protein